MQDTLISPLAESKKCRNKAGVASHVLLVHTDRAAGIKRTCYPLRT